MTPFRLDRHPVVLLRPRIRPPYAWVGHIPFAYLLIDLLRPPLFVELGTDAGNSYLAFCQAVEHLGCGTRCVAIDSWEGDEHARFYGEEVYSTLKAYHDPRYGAFSSLMRQRFEQAVDEFEAGSIDLLHIDGLHTYEAVKSDFETWLPKLSDRAVVVFHDSAVHDRDFGVSTFLDELRDRYRIFEFTHSNGLAVVSVGANVPAPFRAFMDAADTDGDAVSEYLEAVVGTFFDAERQLPIGAETQQLQLDSRLYYRRHGEGNIEERSLLVTSSPELFDGRTLVQFQLKPGLRPDVLRFDPADAPGIFGIASIRFQAGAASSEVRLETSSPRMLGINADRLTAHAPYFLRFTALHSDPGFEFIVDDLWTQFDDADTIDVVFDVNFEAVLGDPVLKLIAFAEDTTLAEFRAFDRREASWAETTAAVTVLACSLKALDERMAGAVSLLDADRTSITRLGSSFEELNEQVVGAVLLLAADRASLVEHKQAVSQALADLRREVEDARRIGQAGRDSLEEQSRARAETTDRQVLAVAERVQEQIEVLARQSTLLERQQLLLEQQSQAIDNFQAATLGARVRRWLGLVPRGSAYPTRKP